MIGFLFALCCLSAIVYYFLDKEFKRLERKYALQRWISLTIRLNLQHFGTSMKQVSEAIVNLSKIFQSNHSFGRAIDLNSYPGKVVSVPKSVKIVYDEPPEE